jgi:hypothetical protein
MLDDFLNDQPQSLLVMIQDAQHQQLSGTQYLDTELEKKSTEQAPGELHELTAATRETDEIQRQTFEQAWNNVNKSNSQKQMQGLRMSGHPWTKFERPMPYTSCVTKDGKGVSYRYEISFLENGPGAAVPSEDAKWSDRLLLTQDPYYGNVAITNGENKSIVVPPSLNVTGHSLKYTSNNKPADISVIADTTVYNMDKPPCSSLDDYQRTDFGHTKEALAAKSMVFRALLEKHPDVSRPSNKSLQQHAINTSTI